MKESGKIIERRQHKRTSVQNLVLGILNSGELETIGSVTDISLDGVRCTYDEFRGAPLCTLIHSIDLIADSHYLFGIPCEYAWNIIFEIEHGSKLTNLRECGIQFANLEPDQIYLLSNIIRHCTSRRAEETISKVNKTYNLQLS